MAVNKGDINPATGKAYAVNPATGVWDDNYWAQNEARFNSGSSGGSGGGGTNFADIAAQTLKMQQEANKPAVESLQASIPTVGSAITQRKTELQSGQSSLEAKYKALVDQIKGGQEEETQSAQIAQSQELGRRGISTQGGLYADTMNEKISPITRYYTGQLTNAGNTYLGANQDIQNQIAGLPLQQTQQEQQIRQAIAQLQAGGNSDAITQALQLYQTNQSQANADADRALQEKLATLKVTSDPLDQAKLLAEIENLQARTTRLQNTGSGSGGDPITELLAILGG